MAFTLDTYGHVTPGMQPEAAEMFRRSVWEDEEDVDEDSEDVA